MQKDCMSDKILMALSGGVDSAACVKVLQQQGYEVSGLVIQFSPAHEKAVVQAKIAAAELGIPLHVAHCEPAFSAEVVAPFCQTYAQGRTPNPCVVCNPKVKFHVLTQQADALGISYIATGHYARIHKVNGISYIAKAASAARDQSYMLYRLPPSVRQRLILPAGELEKSQIRSLASQEGLSSAQAPDSQEICFIPDGDYAQYIVNAGYDNPPGNFIGPEGQILAPHKGVLHYTTGQRKGLGIALGTPVFVQKILANGDVQLCYDADLLQEEIHLSDVVTADEKPLPDGMYEIKIRSVARPVPCQVQNLGDTLHVVFESPQRAPAAGQHGVLYQNDLVVAGGVIEV